MFRMYCARCCFCHGNVVRISPLVPKDVGNSAAMLVFCRWCFVWNTEPESDPVPKSTTPKRGGAPPRKQQKWDERVNQTKMHCVFWDCSCLSVSWEAQQGRKTFQKYLWSLSTNQWWVLQYSFFGGWTLGRHLQEAIKLWGSFPLLCSPCYKWELENRRFSIMLPTEWDLQSRIRICAALKSLPVIRQRGLALKTHL